MARSRRDGVTHAGGVTRVIGRVRGVMPCTAWRDHEVEGRSGCARSAVITTNRAQPDLRSDDACRRFDRLRSRLLSGSASGPASCADVTQQDAAVAYDVIAGRASGPIVLVRQSSLRNEHNRVRPQPHDHVRRNTARPWGTATAHAVSHANEKGVGMSVISVSRVRTRRRLQALRRQPGSAGATAARRTGGRRRAPGRTAPGRQRKRPG